MTDEKEKTLEEMIEELGKVQAEPEEVILSLDLASDALDAGQPLRDIYDRSIAKGKILIKQRQLKLAENNVAMAQWVGKQYLGQQDKQDLNLSGLVPVTIVNDIPRG